MDGDFRTQFVRDPAALKHYPALVLNADYRPLSYYPLSLWPWQEAIKAAVLNRVSIVAEYDHVVRSQRQEFRIPSVVVLKDYVKPQKRVAFTRFNLFLRDEFCCQYCGAKGDLTFDHVVPRSRGGITSWENVVAACSPCNLRKGSKTLRQSGLHLAKVPRAPSPEEMQSHGSHQITCMTAGWIICTGTRNWTPEPQVFAIFRWMQRRCHVSPAGMKHPKRFGLQKGCAGLGALRGVEGSR
jgi:5-methylcytosine-specific restriction endonuclease McrA